MPKCYLLAVAAGSSLDQQSNNVTLFNLVEQVNVPPGVTPRPGSRIPLEVHAYLQADPGELGQEFEMRFSLVHLTTGLETLTDPATHRVPTIRLRTRAMGLPFPAVFGHYDLRIDFRLPGNDEWDRDPLRWPLSIMEFEKPSGVTH